MIDNSSKFHSSFWNAILQNSSRRLDEYNFTLGFLIPGFPRSVGKWQVIKRHRAADWARHCYVTCMESENKNAKKQCHYCSLASRWIIKEWTCYTVRVLCIYIVCMSILSLIFFSNMNWERNHKKYVFFKKMFNLKELPR